MFYLAILTKPWSSFNRDVFVVLAIVSVFLCFSYKHISRKNNQCLILHTIIPWHKILWTACCPSTFIFTLVCSISLSPNHLLLYLVLHLARGVKIYSTVADDSEPRLSTVLCSNWSFSKAVFVIFWGRLKGNILYGIHA